jgi:hypothetical protein
MPSGKRTQRWRLAAAEGGDLVCDRLEGEAHQLAADRFSLHPAGDNAPHGQLSGRAGIPNSSV